MHAGELPAVSAMVPVLARLLEFSPSELQRVTRKAEAAGAQGGGPAAFFSRLPSLSLG